LLPQFANPKLTPQVQIQVGYRKFNALLDTGASHSIIQSKVANLLKLKTLDSNVSEIIIGNSCTVKPVGSCKIKFKFSNQIFSHNFLIMSDLPFPVVLGSDFIFKSKTIIDLSQGYYFLRNKSHCKLSFRNSELLLALQGLSDHQQADLDKLLSKFPDVLSNTVGSTDLVQCELKVTGEPKSQKPYPVSPMKRDIIRTQVQQMIDMGVIRPSTSPWASPIHLKKENDAYRFTMDLRELNKKTISDPFPIPRIDALLHRLGEATFISKIDLKKGYWQIKMHPDSIKYTAFICDQGKFEWLRMPFGLKTAPSIFQRFMNKVLGDARGIFAEAYLDDIVIFSNSWVDHIKHINYIMEQLRRAGLTVNIDKCDFGKTKVKYLGFIITPEGVSTDPDKIDAVVRYPRPKSSKDIKKFLGLCGWYRHFIDKFSDIAEPLNNMLSKDKKFSWQTEQEDAYQTLKSLIANSVVLAYPDFSRPFILRTDASSVGLGCVLGQMTIDGFERPIAFASRSLSKTERNYHPTERECLGIVWALKKFEHYLEGQVFSLQTDNRALLWLNSMKDVNSKFMSWSLKIQDFQPQITHIPGKLNVVADILSRATVGEPEEEDNKEVMHPPIEISQVRLFCSLTSTIDLNRIRNEQQSDPESLLILPTLPFGFIHSNPILFKITSNELKLPFIPKSLRSEIVSYFHDLPHAGHMWFRKTMARISRRVNWPSLHEEVFNFIKSCLVCPTNKNPNHLSNGNMQPNKRYGPWDMLALDLMGPLPTTKI